MCSPSVKAEPSYRSLVDPSCRCGTTGSHPTRSPSYCQTERRRVRQPSASSSAPQPGALPAQQPCLCGRPPLRPWVEGVLHRTAQLLPSFTLTASARWWLSWRRSTPSGPPAPPESPFCPRSPESRGRSAWRGSQTSGGACKQREESAVTTASVGPLARARRRTHVMPRILV